jgi:hypothetical protein
MVVIPHMVCAERDPKHSVRLTAAALMGRLFTIDRGLSKIGRVVDHRRETVVRESGDDPIDWMDGFDSAEEWGVWARRQC